MPPSVTVPSSSVASLSSPYIPSSSSSNRTTVKLNTHATTTHSKRRPQGLIPSAEQGRRSKVVKDKNRPSRNRTRSTTNSSSLENDHDNNNPPTTTSTNADATSVNAFSNPYSMLPYTGGMYGSPYYGGAMMMTGGPFSGLYQVLFGVQNIVFSLTQFVQLLGTNQHALQQALDALTGMMDHALATFQELRALEAQQTARETEEQRKRRQRLKVLRWSLMVGSTWLLYKIIRRITSSRRRRRIDAGGSLGQFLPYNSAAAGAGGYNSTAWNSMNNHGGIGGVGMNMLGMNPYGGSYGGPSPYY